MTKEQFAQKVKAMRDAQKAYFANRTRSNLNKSIVLEKDIDKQVDKILAYQDKQQTLF